ncbi:stage V sporulation protein D (sporulation-specific penicillin-binding protein) [Hydrogenispora ethanolica]|uniref:Stage V sporulation protein D (Sporulation-specific penicillin-binding protein) n=1 Tax=Hydrogenispora ethanolica TaxID=1082276 RepID=A0A4R1QZ62_HYDET|nr:penicillin-binding transpeptidase domain-containing protein [Hydrogenispora ethanolica]TCL58274.1 stage V sporulation protein D (sporulation-specific penicillin-binding protein) [Hydrogenispora ethanolica]
MSLEVTSKKRLAVLLFIALILTGCLVLRVIYLQVFMAGWLKKSAEAQRLRSVPVQARRGTIYDRLGNELATSVDADSVYAVPAEIENPSKTAMILSEILGLDKQKIQGLIAKRASFVWVKRKVTFTEIKRLREAIKVHKLHGIEISQKAQRFYPQMYLASQVLGIAGIDNQGLEGLEKYYDSYLQGVPGRDQAEFDTAGRHIPQGERRYIPPVPGDSIYLTIDQNIQFIAERELEKAVSDTGSKRGMAIAVNPQNGDVLAVAVRPKFDPNQYADYPAENRRNPLFTDMYEPGSTFKIFTAAATLEEGKANLESTFFDPGFIIVDDRRLKCWKAGGHGSQTFIEALENSCNPVFATLALRLGKETFYQHIKAFGFGDLTGIDFPGESAGRLKSLAEVKNVELATIGFGQGITVTPLQMVMGVSAIANGGYLLKPHLVKEIYAPDGKLIKKTDREVVRQAISTKTAKLMARLLQSVVTNGSGANAYLEGYRVAGKTGTAQKVVAGQRGYSQVIASFVAFAPAENPQILVMVLLDEPNISIRYGSVIAAPVVGNILRDTLRYLGVKPKFDEELLPKDKVRIIEPEITVPNVLNLSVAEAVSLLKKSGIEYRISGSGNSIYDQTPKPGVVIGKGSKVLLYLDPTGKYNLQNDKVVLPNLQGLDQPKAEKVITELGLKIEIVGRGVVVSQNPLPGTALRFGSTVRITCQTSSSKSP